LVAFGGGTDVLIAKDREMDRQSAPAKRDGSPQDLALSCDGALIDDHRQIATSTKTRKKKVQQWRKALGRRPLQIGEKSPDTLELGPVVELGGYGAGNLRYRQMRIAHLEHAKDG
jgi:hypothetical protein